VIEDGRHWAYPGHSHGVAAFGGVIACKGEALEDMVWEQHNVDSMSYGSKSCMTRAY